MRSARFPILIAMLAQLGPASCARTDCAHLKAQNPLDITACYADQGFMRDQYKLGMALMYGDGVAVDREKAAHYFAAASMDRPNETWIYVSPIGGEKYGHVERIKMRPPEKGLSAAQYQLGLAYMNGWGVEPSDKRARYWLKRAARSGQMEAFDLLRQIGEREEGNGKDEPEDE